MAGSVPVTGKGFWCDYRVQRNIDCMTTLIKNDWDHQNVIDGQERGGKTKLAWTLVLGSDKDLQRSVECEEYAKLFRLVARDHAQYIKLLQTLAFRLPLLRDEAVVMAREAMTRVNREIVRVLSTIGNQNRFSVWDWTDFNSMDRYVKLRTHVRGFVRAPHGKRGLVLWYVRKRYPWPLPGGDIFRHYYAFWSRFISFEEMGRTYAEFWAKNRELEWAAKKAILHQGEPTEGDEALARRLYAEHVSVRKISKALKKDRGTVTKWLAGLETPQHSEIGEASDDETDRQPTPSA